MHTPCFTSDFTSKKSLPPYIYPVKRLITSKSIGNWCQLPYDGHPNGCPNYKCAEKCPPKSHSIDEYFNISKPLWLVHSEFNLANHILTMEEKHPQWSLKQCRCVLYWQSVSRKQLKDRIKKAISILNIDGVAMVPEAMGVNVYATARLSGLHLERIRHLGICRHVALVGDRKFGQIKLF